MTADKRAEAAEVEALAAALCAAYHEPPIAVPIHEDPRCRVAACFMHQAAAHALLTSALFARRLAEARAEGAQAVLAAVEAVIGPDEVFPDWSKYPHRHRVAVKRRDLGAEVTTTMVDERAIRAAARAAAEQAQPCPYPDPADAEEAAVREQRDGEWWA